MKKLISIFILTAIFFAITITAFAQNPTGRVGLNVTIDNTVSVGYGVQSDGAPYQHEINSVTAFFGTYGHFVFNSGTTRPITFVYSFQLDGQSVLDTQSTTLVKARTFPINSTGYTRMQDMTPGQSQCLGLTWEPINIGTNTTRGVSYHYGGGDLSNTAYVVVTYSNNVWTMQSVESPINCGGNNQFDNAARVRDSTTIKNKTTTVDRGRYYMPFKLIITRQ